MENRGRAIIMANMHQKGLMFGRKVEVTTKTSGAKTLITTVDMGDKVYGEQGVCRYNTDLQDCYPAPRGGTVIIAPYGNFDHFFLATPAQEGHEPEFFFLARSGKR